MRWTSLKRFAAVKLVRGSVLWLLLVPFLARFVDARVGAASASGAAVGTAEFSLSSTFVLLYVAALFFAIGHGLRLAFMPRLLAGFDDLHAYEASGRTNAELEWFFPDVWRRGIELGSLNWLAQEFQLGPTGDEQRDGMLEALARRLRGSTSETDFWAVHHALDRHHRRGLWLTATAYGLGLVAAGCVFVDGLFVVMRYSGL